MREQDHGHSAGLIYPPKPRTLFSTNVPTLKEVKEVVRSARTASGPGPNEVPYKVFKQCPRLAEHLGRSSESSGKERRYRRGGSMQREYGFPRRKTQETLSSSGQSPSLVLNVRSSLRSLPIASWDYSRRTTLTRRGGVWGSQGVSNTPSW